MTDDERREALEAIAEEVRACTACRLHRGRQHAVPGEGSAATEVVFVGEGPGANEDEQGRPFVGAAGGLLSELIRSIGWQRDEVFITNVVKCRPPGNRDPEPDEIVACSGYLHRQLEALDPALIVTLGRFSLQSFMPGARISAAHGTVRPVDPATGAADASVMALYHPAAAFRQVALKDTLFEDVAGVPDALLSSRQRRAANRAANHESGLEAGVSAAAALPSGPAGAEGPPAPGEAWSPSQSSAIGPPATPDTSPVPTDDAAATPDIVPEPAFAAAEDPNQMRFF